MYMCVQLIHYFSLPLDAQASIFVHMSRSTMLLLAALPRFFVSTGTLGQVANRPGKSGAASLTLLTGPVYIWHCCANSCHSALEHILHHLIYFSCLAPSVTPLSVPECVHSASAQSHVNLNNGSDSKRMLSSCKRNPNPHHVYSRVYKWLFHSRNSKKQPQNTAVFDSRGGMRRLD